ncbi:HupE/UreJ family protein [Maribacter sp. 2304DJ31-5]|uniref:HupE/UreJ family protein n=1 Tax=Maribacter sp. 2304DJ31-5 TaxID=3386273 RepID=UPI0039BD7CD3
MQEFWFYIQLGLNHVLDINAYDHILFLSALAVPFTFKSWREVVFLATVFTITHCLSLVLSAFEIVIIDVPLIEFLIPVTIVITAIFNILYQKMVQGEKNIVFHVVATAFFGLIHGFGFSNYFKMLVAGEEERIMPLLGFALGIEISQVIIVLCVLLLAYVLQSKMKIKQSVYILTASGLILLITIPLLYATFLW